MTNELEVQPGETAEQFKMRIEKKQAELTPPLSEGKLPQPGSIDPRLEAPARTPAPSKSETPQGINPPANASPATNGKPTVENVDPQEWLKKKGFKSDEDLIRSYRQMEEEFHRRNQGKWNQSAPPSGGNMPPQLSNGPQPGMGQPTYGHLPSNGQSSMAPPPPIAPTNPGLTQQAVYDLSRLYNIPVEDVPRLYAFNRDQMNAVLENALAARDRQWQQHLQPIENETKRNSEFRRLMQDPAFRNPEVQMEMERVLTEDSEAFTRESEPYIWANERALVNIARRNLQANGSSKSDPMSSGSSFYPPSNPPRNLGSGTGESNETVGLSQKDFSELPLEEQRKFLQQMGAVARKY